MHPPSDLVGGRWIPIPGDTLVSRNPAHTDRVVWSGTARREHVNEAIASARAALPEWSNWPRERRFEVLRHFQKLCAERLEAVTNIICDETGKVLWDAKAEAGLLGPKVDITLDASANSGMARVTPFDVPLAASRVGRCWFRPHGVMAVIGPFNFPAHLPNGHIVPALAMGNTVVLKPSDKTPGSGQVLIELLDEALRAHGAPAGVVNLVQGGADVAKALTGHDEIDGILFTGSWPVGRAIMEANLDRPGRILALEMGGNNPAVVMPDADLKQAVLECVRSAFVTSGQRCTCTRRIIVHRDIASTFVPLLLKAASNLIVGEPRATHPVFMGPMISAGARGAVLAFQASAREAGARVLLEATIPDSPSQGHYLTPGVLEVERFTPAMAGAGAPVRDAGCDVEVFGPLVRVSTAESFDDALTQANATQFGLAASIFTRDSEVIERFLRGARAGCINVNTGTAGASSKLPFGGLGQSGNHRPAGSFSLDYCAYPVAGMIESGDAAQVLPGMRFEESWLKR